MYRTYPVPEIGMVVSEGLPFHSCRKCAWCCMNKVVPLYGPDMDRLGGIEGYFVPTKEAERWITGARHKMRMVDGKCVFLKGNLCAQYDLRPDTCRRHPFIVTESWILVNPSCPGLDWTRRNAEGEGHYRELSSGVCKGIDAFLAKAGCVTPTPTRLGNPRRRGVP